MTTPTCRRVAHERSSSIVPLQLAGRLASDVLKVAGAKKAIADRACGRSDERRWRRGADEWRQVVQVRILEGKEVP